MGPHQFAEFSLPYIRKISAGVRDGLKQKGLPVVPLIVFAKGGHHSLSELAHSEYNVVGLDWTVSPIAARQAVGSHVTLQGNLDPCALYADKKDLEEAVSGMVAEFGQGPWIANLGHGIYPDMDPEHAGFFIDCVHRLTQKPS